MNDHTIALVRESFDLIEPIAPQAGALFFANLFDADPSLQRLFDGDIEARGANVMQMVELAVDHLDRPEALVPVLHTLGQRLAAHGVLDRHYDSFGDAMLKTLYQGLGVAYNGDVEDAWVDAYGFVAKTMKEAASVPA